MVIKRNNECKGGLLSSRATFQKGKNEPQSERNVVAKRGRNGERVMIRISAILVYS